MSDLLPLSKRIRSRFFLFWCATLFLLSCLQVPAQDQPAAAESSKTVKEIRVVYLIPSDRSANTDYKAAAADAIRYLQDFFQTQLGNTYTFSLHSPKVESYQTSHDSSYYNTHHNADWPANSYFWFNAIEDGYAVTLNGFNANTKWVFYIDADPACGQAIGGGGYLGGGGTVVVAGNDLRGLTDGQNVPACANELPDTGGKFRWIGGLGHNLLRSFGLDRGTDCGALTDLGYRNFPFTYITPADQKALLSSGFFSQKDPNQPEY